MSTQRSIDFLLLVFALILLQAYLQWNSLNFLLGIPALWLYWNQPSAKHLVPKYDWVSWAMLLLLLVLSISIPVQTLFYLAVVGYFMARSSEEGKSGISLFLFIALLMSPLAEYFFRVFSFPLRLWISKIAVLLLQSLGEPVKGMGNVIEMAGKEFSVDTACMGLNLTTASMLCGLLVLLVLQRNLERQLGMTWMVVYMMAVFCLNVLSNLIRILMLVKFQIFPEDPMHEVLGLISTLVYVCFPAWWLAGSFLKKFGTSKQPFKNQQEDIENNKTAYIKPLLYLLFIIAGWCVLEHKDATHPYQQPMVESKMVDGFELSHYSKDVIKLSGNGQLVYVKTIPDFFTPEHSPMICWQGSGYDLQKIAEMQVNGFKCYEAELVQGTQKLYTAWWFGNGNTYTNSQLEWRWNSFRTGSRYSLINCTVSNRKDLGPSIFKLMESKGFRNLIGKP